MLKVIAYVTTFVSVLAASKSEAVLFALLALIVIFLILNSSPQERIWLTVSSVVIGTLMTTAEYTCVKYYKIWQYHDSKYTIPIWLPLLWAIASLFVLDVFNKTRHYLQ
jgi:hypothetical protein